MKTNNEKFQESVKFVACHYEHGAFSSRKSWNKIVNEKTFSWKRNIAVAAVACVILAASAFLYIALKPSNNYQKTIEKQETIVTNPQIETSKTSAKLEFTDASLLEVVKKIEETYGVNISGIPDEELKLTLSYEGTAEDIIATINETLQINLVIDNKESLELSNDK